MCVCVCMCVYVCVYVSVYFMIMYTRIYIYICVCYLCYVYCMLLIFTNIHVFIAFIASTNIDITKYNPLCNTYRARCDINNIMCDKYNK